MLASSLVIATALWQSFVNPPASARPHVWWHWMNGNVTREGITADLEAMARVGIGGAQLFDAGCSVPAGPLKYYSPEWFDTVKFAAGEARRLGLELCLPNCSGWSSSGGPWITPERGMKRVFFTETIVTGGGKVTCTLPKPHPFADSHSSADYYRDIAVLAVPLHAPNGGASATELMARVKISSPTCTNHTETLEAIIDASPDSSIVFTGLDRPQDFILDFGEPIPSRGMSLNAGCYDGWDEPARRSPFELFVSNDGKEWTSVFKDTYPTDVDSTQQTSYSFGREVTARYWKLRLGFRLNKNCHMSFRWWHLGNMPELHDFAKRVFDTRQAETSKNLPTLRLSEKTGYEAPLAEIRDLTKAAVRGADDVLAVSAELPAGKWRILRFGYGANGRCNHPASEKGVGLEVDKLNARHLDYHFDAYMGKLMDHLGPLGGKVKTGLNGCLVDSYEVGSQNWTDGFKDEFIRRMGYDPTPYLPVLAREIVESVEVSDRFLWDFRRVIASLFSENYSKRLAEKCHERGLKLSLEPYGDAPCCDLEYGRWADVPMSEFWWGGIYEKPDEVALHGSVRHVTSVANVWGQPIVAAESFTTMPEKGRWRQGPWEYKPFNDLAFAQGVNRIVYHRYAHQPWTKPNYFPGMTMGPWGTFFERTVTWWDHGAAEWLKYQSRCQAVLQAGKATGGILQFTGDAVPNASRVPAPPWGYSSDTLAADGLAALRVENGALVAPSGIRYDLLQLRDDEDLTRETLGEIERLGKAGARMCAASVPTHSFGLRDFRDEAAFAARMASVYAKYVFKGTLEEAIAKFGVSPDVRLDASVQPFVSYLRKRAADGTEYYFIASRAKKPLAVELELAPVGKRVEWWDPVTGRRHAVKQERLATGTKVSLALEICASGFLVFADGADETEALPPADFAEVGTVGDFTVTFPVLPVAGLPASGETRTWRMTSPQDWTKSDDPEIRYFSGTATYRAATKVAPETAKGLWLDLGEVGNFAEVTVNGKPFPALWKPPFRVFVGDLIGADGALKLEVKVTNFWTNRLIGDEFLPADAEWKKEWGGASLVAIPDWVKNGKSSPHGRRTFSTWWHLTKDDTLLPSGILGPVRLVREVR